MSRSRVFAGTEYIKALKKNYPQLLKNCGNMFGFVKDWISRQDQLDNYDLKDRFVSLSKRPFILSQNAWTSSASGDYRWMAARMTYKGLINLKPPFDLVLYSNLIWELQPRTILEFGSLQGGSALWLGDQLNALCGGGEVHSFELLIDCIHERAKAPNVKFHSVDLNDLHTLDKKLFARLPHPWLVIDDAHVNFEKLVPFVTKFMKKGDYYIWEDLFLSNGTNEKTIREMTSLADKCKLSVDVKYTDAFGTNVTCSPNGWFRKSG